MANETIADESFTVFSLFPHDEGIHLPLFEERLEKEPEEK